MNAGDGLGEKCVFVTTEGELLVFTGTDPTSVTNWRQEGRYDISRPLGKNAHQQLAGDVLILTVDGVVPLSAAIQKDVSALSLAAITLPHRADVDARAESQRRLSMDDRQMG